MNKLLTALTIAAFATTGAFAQEATPDTWMNTGLSGKTRAEVSTELAAARKSGLTRSWSAGYMQPLRNSALRATVRASTLQALQSGEIAAINAEVYSFTPVTAQKLAQATK